VDGPDSPGPDGPAPGDTTDRLPLAPARGRGRLVAIVAAALVVLVAVVVTIVVSTRGPDTPGASAAGPPPPADGLGSDVAITVDGDRILRGGQPWWFLGYNSFTWSGDCGDDDERMSPEQVEEWFASMRHDGHGAVRLFFFDGWDLDRLDAAVESAQRHDLYLMITLDDGIGGCGESDKDDAWFADQAERDTFRGHMTSLLERYRGVGTIAWFEYFNEPDTDVEQLRPFYDEMGAVADGVDPGRLFASGTIAPYDGGPASFLRVHESSGVDVASMHEYDEGEVESNHGPEVREGAAGKPVIVGEFGLYASADGVDCARAFDERAEQVAGKAEAYTTIEGYVGGMAWAWQPGGDACEYGNLDEDTASQDVLRSYTLTAPS
jgi:hypothetical protein